MDSDVTKESMASFDSGSTSTTVLTYGGPPGAYSPDADNGPSTFGEWARGFFLSFLFYFIIFRCFICFFAKVRVFLGVPLLPVPIEYELDAIGNVIPDTWVTPGRVPYKQVQIRLYNFSERYKEIERKTN